MFLEYDYYNDDLQRSRYFWSAYNQGSASFPLVILDSGNQVSSGYSSARTDYKQMVDSALGRQAGAEIAATWWREGDHVVTSVQVTNRSDVALGGRNDAQVHAIVYENNKVKLTSRFVRATTSTAIGEGFASLAPGATDTYVLVSKDLAGVDWAKLDVVAIVDYRPSEASRAYDALQAAPAAEIDNPFAVSASSVVLFIDPAGERPGAERRRSVQIAGAAGLSWSAATTAPWLVVTPMTGTINTTVQIAADPALLAEGWQEGVVTFTAEGGFERTVSVRAFRGSVWLAYLPAALK